MKGVRQLTEIEGTFEGVAVPDRLWDGILAGVGIGFLAAAIVVLVMR